MTTQETSLTFALVDVKRGRRKLAATVGEHMQKVPITLSGYIIGQWSGDDGTSIEFEVAVTKHRLGKPVKNECTCVRCMTGKSRPPNIRRFRSSNGGGS